MNDRPDAVDLLTIARRTLIDDVLPGVPQDLRYSTLMIANAMSIAQREIAAGNGAGEAELARLHDLLGEAQAAAPSDALRSRLESSNGRLAAAIRGGEFDGPKREALLRHLHETCVEKLAVSNPKALEP